MKTRIAGIPCQVELVSYNYYKPQPWNDASDLDFYGGFDDIVFRVLDRRGNPAPWLERKLTQGDISRIENELIVNLEKK